MCGLGANVTVMDLKSGEDLAPAVSQLSDLPLQFCFGPHRKDLLEKSDLIVLNPAVSRDSDIVSFASRRGLIMTSPMNIFLALCPAPAVAVTGSVGKSTTTAMLSQILRETGRTVHMGGNIGISLLASLDRICRGDTVVLELSSVQLEDAAALPFSPHVAVVTNILPNHLDIYGGFEAYAAAKENIVRYQRPEDAAVLNFQDRLLRDRWTARLKGGRFFFDAGGEWPVRWPDFKGVRLEEDKAVWQDEDGGSEVLFQAADVSLVGAHNMENALAAATAARWLGAGADSIRRALRRFKPLEHRLERCRRMDGITFYNDSDSTTPDSTIAALRSFPPPITLICGGKNKGLSFLELAEIIAERVDVLVTIGQCGPRIARMTREAGVRMGASPIIMEARSLSDAVSAGYRHSMPGSTVLFSPSCSSFDMFQNFAERGREFKKIVDSLGRTERARRVSA